MVGLSCRVMGTIVAFGGALQIRKINVEKRFKAKLNVIKNRQNSALFFFHCIGNLTAAGESNV